MRFSPDDELEKLLDALPPNMRESQMAVDLQRLLAERAWEKWLTRDEWALLGCLARAGESMGVVPRHMDTTAGVMLWALGMVREDTDYKFRAIDVSEGDGIHFLQEWPVSETPSYGYNWNEGTQELEVTGWSNEIFILSTMYTDDGDELKPPPGIAGHFPDPDWELLCQQSVRFLADNATRYEKTMPMLHHLAETIQDYKDRVRKARTNPAIQALIHEAMKEADEVKSAMVH